jgi:trk system potassium uptake protein TrkH
MFKDDSVKDFRDIASWRMSPAQILTAGFGILILLGTILLMLPVATKSGERMSFVDALFMATSSVCVTGLAVVDTGEYFSRFGQVVIVMLLQIGAFGIMTMATLISVILRRRINLRNRLIMQEELNQLTFSGMVRLTLYIIQASLVMEFIGGTILAARFYGDFGLDGIYLGYWHAASAFCNAGFTVLSGDGATLEDYTNDFTINMTITTLIILGGLGFTVMADIWQNRHIKKFRLLTLQTKVVLATSLMLILIGAAAIFILEYNNPATLGSLPLSGKLLASYFQSVTARTAGYNTIDIGLMTNAGLFFVIMLMFIGASPGSTGSGIKTTTFAVIMASIWGMIRGYNAPRLFQRTINPVIIAKSYTLFFIAATLVAFSTMLLCMTEKFSFIQILFEAVSAFSTAGLSTGITGDLTDVGKLCLVITMFIGRIGPVTFALALAMRSKKDVVNYPEGKITIG